VNNSRSGRGEGELCAKKASSFTMTFPFPYLQKCSLDVQTIETKNRRDQILMQISGCLLLVEGQLGGQLGLRNVVAKGSRTFTLRNPLNAFFWGRA
jgi:hypothetical protein